MRVLAGRYELGERVGGGGMAEVFRAHDSRLSRDVAVKILHAQYAQNDAFVQKFRREARSVASLHDPRVVEVFDAGSDGEVHFLVMEYVAGGTLKDGLRVEGRYPETEALDIGAQIAEALEAAHGRGLVHRDLKPQNVLFDAAGKVKVADFGIAKAVGDQLTQTSSVLGSPHYFSPEQAHGRVVDERSDLYSLGVVLYELLTGRPPFEGDSAVEIALRHVNDEPVPPRRLVPDLAPQTEAVVLRAMAKNPFRRFQTAREMKLAILDARDRVEGRVAPGPPLGGPAAPPAASPLPGFAFRGARGRSAAPVVAALLALALLIAGGAFALARRPVVAAPAGSSSAGAGSPTAVAAATTTPRPSASAAPATSPPAATPAPTATPPLAATATPTPPPAAAGAGASAAPASSVTTFYQLVAQHSYDRAAELWSAQMRSRYPPATSINARFSGTTAIDVRRADVVSVDENGGTATVAVDLIEATSSGTRRWTGTWQLVRVGSAWLLDQPNLAGG